MRMEERGRRKPCAGRSRLVCWKKLRESGTDQRGTVGPPRWISCAQANGDRRKTSGPAYCRYRHRRTTRVNSWKTSAAIFAEYIGSQPDWGAGAGVCGRGLSGTAAQPAGLSARCCPPRRREIDLIPDQGGVPLARNTVDALACTRRLRRHRGGRGIHQ